MSHTPALDWNAPLFRADGSVDSGAARAWVAQVHDALVRHHGPAWTDARALWLGRLAHDCLHYQGNAPAELTAEDLDDLLLTLTVAQRATLPAAPEQAVPALRQLFAYGAAEHGSLVARDALLALDDDLERAFMEGISAAPEPESPGAPAAATAGAASPEEPAPRSRAERRARGGGTGRGRVKVRRKTGRRRGSKGRGAGRKS